MIRSAVWTCIGKLWIAGIKMESISTFPFEYVTFPYRLPGLLSCITPSLKQMSVIFLRAFY